MMPPSLLARFRARCTLCNRLRNPDTRGFTVCAVCDAPPPDTGSLANITFPVPPDLRRAYEAGRGHENEYPDRERTTR